MEDALQQLGFSEKEVKFYLFLLNEGPNTAAGLAKLLSESRTNSYMLLDGLAERNLVVADDSKPVRRYAASNPTELKGILDAKQQELKTSSALLNSVMPQLSSIYNLGEHKPGVIYLQGLNGFEAFLQDVNKAGERVDIIASDVSPENTEAFDMLQRSLDQRKSKSIKSRLIFHEGARAWLDKNKFAARGMDVRFWGEQPLEGEIVVYSNKLALTVYKPTLIVTVITNDVLAGTFKTVFEHMWSTGKTT